MSFDSRTRARLIAIFMGLNGAVNIASSLYVDPRLEWLLNVMPSGIVQGSRSLTLVIGFFMASVALNLAKRKRRAWLTAVILLTLLICAHLLKGLDIVEAGFALIILGVLWRFRGDFTVRSDPRSVRRLLFAAPYALIIFTTYSILGFYLLRGEFQPSFNLWFVLGDVLRLATLQGNTFYKPLTLEAGWFTQSITLMTAVTILFIAHSVMLHVLRPETSTRGERENASAIIHAYGSSDLAYFDLGHDKSYFFNEDETCVVAYVVKNGVAISAGEPIGIPEEIPKIIRPFKKFCEENDWVPAFHSIPESSLPLYTKEGFKPLKVGEEAFVDVQKFDLDGKEKNDLRSAVNRAARGGWHFLFFDRPVADPALVEMMKSISEEWLSEKFGGEMGFTMGGTPIAGSDETLVTLATGAGGEVLAFMTWAPMYGARGWVGDFVRRSRGAPHGVIDYIIVSTIFKLRERGDKVLGLGMAPLTNVEAPDPEVRASLERVFELIYERFNSVYRFKSLYHFKKKYEPVWEGRYLLYPKLEVLPLIIYAFLNAHLPNFSISEIERLVRRQRLGVPRLRRRLNPREEAPKEN